MVEVYTKETLPRRLGEADLEIVLPESIATRWDVAVAMKAAVRGNQSTVHRIFAGALGVCWPRVYHRLPYSGDIIKYGGQVMDMLMTDNNVPFDKLLLAGRYCQEYIQANLVNDTHLETARDFSKDPTVA